MTEEESRNVDILRDGYARWSDSKAGSASHWMSLMVDDVHWCSLGAGGEGQEFTGACFNKQGVQAYFEALGAEWELVAYEADEFVAQGDRVVMLGRCHWRNRRTGKEVNSPKADVLRMREGKIVGFMDYYDTAQVVAAARGDA